MTHIEIWLPYKASRIIDYVNTFPLSRIREENVLDPLDLELDSCLAMEQL
jgi:hypothetical protein